MNMKKYWMSYNHYERKFIFEVYMNDARSWDARKKYWIILILIMMMIIELESRGNLEIR